MGKPLHDWYVFGRRLMDWMTGDNQTRADEILWKYRRWRYGPSNRGHLARELMSLAVRYQDDLYELIFSGKPTEDELHELIFLGGHWGSCARRRNEHWVVFVDRVRQRQTELPESIQDTLDWYLQAHGW